MESFDLDLEDLDLKSVDIKPTTPTHGDYKHLLYNSPTHSYQPGQPNLTVSTNNRDAMPTGLNSDKAIDLGLDLLVNKKKIGHNNTDVNKLNGTSQSLHSNPNNMYNMNDTNNNNASYSTGGFPERVNLDNTDLLQKSLFDDNFTNIDLEKELSTVDLQDISKPTPSMNGPSLPNFGSQSANGTTNTHTAASATSGFGMNSGYGNINTGNMNNVPHMSFEEILQKKFDLLCKFERLRDKGVRLPKTFSMSSSYEEMDMEYRRLIEHRQLDISVKRQKQMLVSFSTGVESLNHRFDPFDLQLDGWSQNITDSVSEGEYDDIFEELFYKYRDTFNLPPELKLAGAVAMSGFWYHIMQNMAKNIMPSMMNNIMKQNPDLMNQFQQATINTMKQSNPGFAEFASNMTPGPPKYNPMAAPPFANPQAPPPRGQTNINSTDDIDALLDNINS